HPGIPERPPRTDAWPQFLAQARRRRFDVAIQAYGARPAADEVTAQIPARHRAGFAVAGSVGTDPSRHLPYPHDRHEIDRHLDLMRLLGAPPADRALELPLTADDRRAAAGVRTGAGLTPPYALLHPGATSSSRRWPPQHFAAVGDALAARGLAVAVTGVAAEAPVTAAVVSAMSAPAADLSGRTTLGSLAALLDDAALLVASDTGVAHLAAAVRTPSVTAFLSGDPVRWAHPSPLHRTARVDVGCNPCPHLDCPIDHRCAARLSPGAVLAEAEQLLARPPAPPECQRARA
ncbi:MAG TPA: glycosyltransferase family 9 protein, partial [Solirubrobacteraceae bacterium]|nr:glycosyltransferase family 9 protein [Solirubrobacteraceae bacterium]